MLKELWCYVKLGFGMYFGYTLAKYTDQFLEVKYHEYKAKKQQEEAYIQNDIKNTCQCAKEQTTE